jgi:alkyl sulfatase BDS1-like metallo-beta-lactamase superfamily hydrolase
MSSGGTPGETGSRAVPAANPSKSKEEVRQLVASDDGRDLEFAERGFIATRKDPLIRGQAAGPCTIFPLMGLSAELHPTV